jgi:RNA polymerase sigma-70 factor (ECF subfamily)
VSPPSLSSQPSADELLAHAAWVRRIARALVHGVDRRDELEQETWLSALSHPPRHAGDLRRWFSAVARNVVRKLSRADETRQRHSMGHGSGPSAKEPAAAELVARAELQQRVAAAVLALEEPYRATVLARYFDELAPAEIARALGVSVETVKTRLKRGLAQLRDALEPVKGDAKTLEAALSPLCLPLAAALAPAGAKVTAVVVKLAAALLIAAFVHVVVRATRPRAAPPHEPATASAALATNPTSGTATQGATDAKRETVEVDDPTPGKPDPAPLPTSGAIHGVVVDEHGETVEGATVFVAHESDSSFKSLEELRNSASSLFSSRGTSRVWRRFTTDVRGEFDCTELGLGDVWAVAAIHPDVGIGWKGGVTLTADAAQEELEVVLEPGTVICGTVRTRDGRPIENAGGIIDGADRRNEHPFSAYLPGTNERGEFRSLPLPWHWIRFQLSADGMMQSLVPSQEVPAGTREWHVDFVLDPIATLHGRIVDGDGNPARLDERLASLLTPEERARQSRETLAVLGLAKDPRRDPSGLAHVPAQLPNQSTSFGGFAYGSIALAEDAYDLRVVDATMHYVVALVRDRVVGVAEIVEPGRAPDLVVDLRDVPRASRLVGLKLHRIDGSTGRPLDQGEVDLRSVGITSSGGDDYTQLRLASFDDPSPDLSLQAPLGEWLLQVGRGGYVARTMRLSLRAGMEPLEFTIALFPEGATLRGQLLDDEQQPADGAELLVYRLPELEPIYAWGSVPGSSDANGRFEMNGLSSGRCALVAWKPGFAPAVATTEAKPAGAEVSLALTRGVDVRVQFRDANGAKPRRVHVRVTGADGVPHYDDEFPRRAYPHSYFNWSGAADGHIRIAEGEYTVSAFGPNGSHGSASLATTAAREITVVLEEPR